eukprot:TRINITY_DN6785_c0_g1_i1.p1 TRINITY_DN6785_c0_g1~~TRINITY_DN6785_c0_g1_i1.p1  ORF type:complete len:690 (+),score=257.95 TRINITY_DN6785_c0_g1_i1:73-2142(+)
MKELKDFEIGKKKAFFVEELKWKGKEIESFERDKEDKLDRNTPFFFRNRFYFVEGMEDKWKRRNEFKLERIINRQFVQIQIHNQFNLGFSSQNNVQNSNQLNGLSFLNLFLIFHSNFSIELRCFQEKLLLSSFQSLSSDSNQVQFEWKKRWESDLRGKEKNSSIYFDHKWKGEEKKLIQVSLHVERKRILWALEDSSFYSASFYWESDPFNPQFQSPQKAFDLKSHTNISPFYHSKNGFWFFSSFEENIWIHFWDGESPLRSLKLEGSFSFEDSLPVVFHPSTKELIIIDRNNQIFILSLTGLKSEITLNPVVQLDLQGSTVDLKWFFIGKNLGFVSSTFEKGENLVKIFDLKSGKSIYEEIIYEDDLFPLNQQNEGNVVDIGRSIDLGRNTALPYTFVGLIGKKIWILQNSSIQNQIYQMNSRDQMNAEATSYQWNQDFLQSQISLSKLNSTEPSKRLEAAKLLVDQMQNPSFILPSMKSHTFYPFLLKSLEEYQSKTEDPSSKTGFHYFTTLNETIHSNLFSLKDQLNILTSTHNQSERGDEKQRKGESNIPLGEFQTPDLLLSAKIGRFEESLEVKAKELKSANQYWKYVNLLLHSGKWDEVISSAHELTNSSEKSKLFWLLLDYCLKTKEMDKLEQIWQFMPSSMTQSNLLSILENSAEHPSTIISSTELTIGESMQFLNKVASL